MKVVEGANSSMIYLIYCKNFCKCRNVLPPSTPIKFKKIKNKASNFKQIVHESYFIEFIMWILSGYIELIFSTASK
jgi:hypothetical protein